MSCTWALVQGCLLLLLRLSEPPAGPWAPLACAWCGCASECCSLEAPAGAWAPVFPAQAQHQLLLQGALVLCLGEGGAKVWHWGAVHSWGVSASRPLSWQRRAACAVHMHMGLVGWSRDSSLLTQMPVWAQDCSLSGLVISGRSCWTLKELSRPWSQLNSRGGEAKAS